MSSASLPAAIGRWVVEGELGRGGMGVVFRARDPSSGRLAAVKVILDPDADGQARFDRELEAMERLDHPGIVRLLERGKANGRVYAALELVQGHPLPEQLDVADVLDVGLQVARALEHAHERGVLHRDLKPSNILREPSGQVKLLDFGLARLGDRSRLTRTGATLGTPAYMPPEQVEGKADARSDVYGLGATLYALITGAAPFRGGSMENLLVKVLTQVPPSCSSVRDGVPPGLDALVLRCLAKEPEDRPQTAGEVAAALQALRAGADPVAAARRRRRALLVGSLATSITVVTGVVGGAHLILRWKGEAASAALASSAAERRRLSDEGVARLLEGDLASARAIAKEHRLGTDGATLAALLLAVDPREGPRAAAALAKLDEGPAVRLGRALAAGRARAAAASTLRSPIDPPALPLEVAREGPIGTRLATALLAEGDVDGALALAPWTALDALPPAAVGALERLLCARVAKDPVGTAALVDPLLGLFSPELRAALARAAEALLAERLASIPETFEEEPRFLAYRAALEPYRLLLRLEPGRIAEVPGGLRGLSDSLLGERALDNAADLKARSEAEEVAKAFHKEHLSGKAGDLDRAKLVARALVGFEQALRMAGTTRGRLEVSWEAVELLCHADGQASRAVEWCEKNLRQDVKGPRDFIYLTAWAFALHLAGRTREGLALLDRVVEDDPIHGDPLQVRAWIRMRRSPREAGDLDAAAADALRAAKDQRFSRRMQMRGGYKNAWHLLAEIEELRGDLPAARRACDDCRRDATGADAKHDERQRRLDALLGAR